MHDGNLLRQNGWTEAMKKWVSGLLASTSLLVSCGSLLRSRLGAASDLQRNTVQLINDEKNCATLCTVYALKQLTFFNFPQINYSMSHPRQPAASILLYWPAGGSTVLNFQISNRFQIFIIFVPGSKD